MYRDQRSPTDSHATSRRYSDDYSDGSFYSDQDDNESRVTRKSNGHYTSRKRGSKERQRLHTPKAEVKKSPTKSYSRKQTNVRTSQSYSVKGAPKTVPLDYVKRRMLSARKLKLNELRSECEQLATQLAEMKDENKLLKKQTRIQEKALVKYEDQEGDLPRLLSKYSEEIRSLKEHLKTSKAKNQNLNSRIKEHDLELEKTKKLLHKYKQLVEEKDLRERDTLTQKLTKSEQSLEESQLRVHDLERHMEILKKNHKHENGLERLHAKDALRQVDILTQELEVLRLQLKEKDKELEIRNIYSNRIAKPPHRLTSTNSTPVPSPAVPLNLSNRKKHHRKNSDPGLTPREKAKAFDQRRREEERQISHRAQPEPKPSEPASSQQQTPLKAPNFTSLKQNKAPETPPKQDSDRALLARLEQAEREREAADRAEALRREQELREQQELDLERQRQEQLEKELQQQEVERVRLERELAAKQKIESERLVRELEQQRIEREKLERQKLEKERQENERLRVEREEEQRQTLLANSAAEKEKQRQKELLLARMKAIDEQKKGSSDNIIESESSSPKNGRRYSFTKQIENMHAGKPAREDITVPVLEKTKKKALFDDDDDDAGGYKPSFLQSPKKTYTMGNEQPKRNISKKKNLLNDLFGGDKDTKEGSDDLEWKAPQNGRPMSREQSGDFIPLNGSFHSPSKDNNKILPRRARQNSTHQAKPLVNAIDVVEDEIEEVML